VVKAARVVKAQPDQVVVLAVVAHHMDRQMEALATHRQSILVKATMAVPVATMRRTMVLAAAAVLLL
jgi:hypothetical protein